MSFIEEYKKILENGYTKVIFSYDIVQGVYNYKPYYHTIETNWENAFKDILIKNLLHYCYYSTELDRFEKRDIDDLETCIRMAVSDRLNRKLGNYKQDGLCGELLIDLILSMENINYQMLICRLLYQKPNNKEELKSYDLLMFTKSESGIKLILGQAKTGNYSNCQTEIKKDLNSKYTERYFGEQICYIYDRIAKRSENELHQFVDDLNDILFHAHKEKLSKKIIYKNIVEYFKEKNIEIEIPCLLFYDNINVYANTHQIEVALKQEIERVRKHFDEQIFNIEDFNYKIIFYIFPTKNVNTLRNMLMDYKKSILEEKEALCG